MWRSFKKEKISEYKNKKKTPRKIAVGNHYVSEIYGEYCVISFSHKDPQRRKHFNVKFKNTGYVDSFNSNTIMNGKAKDYLFPSVHGIGYLGSKRRVQNKRAKKLWDGILNRCYGNHIHAKYYKDAGVTVSDRWLNFTYFLEDLTFIDGYSEDLFNAGKLVLDKDLKQKNKDIVKIYKLETCTFITTTENLKLIDHSNAKGSDFTALSPKGVFYKGNNISKFSREHNLNPDKVTRVIREPHKHNIHGWSFGDNDSSLEFLRSEQQYKK